MPICGFNNKMRNGLKAFMEGLVEHGLEHRAEKNSETIDQAIKRELSDMSRMQLELGRIEDSGKRVMTEGIVRFAQGFYLRLRKEGGIKNYKDVIERLDEYFDAMDNKYYSELEGDPRDMEKLIEFLNQKAI